MVRRVGHSPTPDSALCAVSVSRFDKPLSAIGAGPGVRLRRRGFWKGETVKPRPFPKGITLSRGWPKASSFHREDAFLEIGAPLTAGQQAGATRSAPAVMSPGFEVNVSAFATAIAADEIGAMLLGQFVNRPQLPRGTFWLRGVFRVRLAPTTDLHLPVRQGIMGLNFVLVVHLHYRRSRSWSGWERPFYRSRSWSV